MTASPFPGNLSSGNPWNNIWTENRICHSPDIRIRSPICSSGGNPESDCPEKRRSPSRQQQISRFNRQHRQQTFFKYSYTHRHQTFTKHTTVWPCGGLTFQRRTSSQLVQTDLNFSWKQRRSLAYVRCVFAALHPSLLQLIAHRSQLAERELSSNYLKSNITYTENR